jgi:hypothetical protein
MGRGLSEWRLELTLVAAVSFVIFVVKDGPLVVSVPVFLAVLTGGYCGRDRICWTLHAATVRRAWRHAVEDCGLKDRCGRVTPAPAGDRLVVRVARGASVTGLEKRADELAACMRVGELRVQRDRRDAGRATVTLVRRDPFVDMPPVPWPGLDPASAPSVWDRIRVGTTEEGEPLTLRIVGNQVLVGGVTGAGKSVFLRSILATAALDPHARLWLLDAKLVELAPWAAAAEELVGPDGPRAVRLLERLRAEVDRRQAEIVASGSDKIRRASGLPVHVIVVDELGEFASMPEGKEIMLLLRSVAARGRALGVTVVAATQSPYADVIDSALRTQFKTRVVFRCMDRGHASTIVGNGPLAQLAADIPDGLPGVGYAADESGTVERFRSVLIARPDDDHPDRADDVLGIVERAVSVRLDADFAALAPLAPLAPLADEPPRRGGQADSAPSRQADSAPSRQGPRGRRGQEPTLLRAVVDLLGDEPVTQSELARRLGREPSDRSVRRALAALEEQGRAVRRDAGWTSA